MMSDNRQLWTGPYGAALADRALELMPIDASGLWIVPAPLARGRAARFLTRRRGVCCRLRVWCWDDLWREVGLRSPTGPSRLSEAGVRSVLREAIGRARREGR